MPSHPTARSFPRGTSDVAPARCPFPSALHPFTLRASASVTFALLVGAALTPAARAQDAPVELDDLTVEATAADQGDVRQPTSSTATGTPTPTDELPVTLTNVSNKVIEDQQAFRLADIYRNAPNVQEPPTKGNTQSIHVPFIRGFQTGGVYRNGLFMHANGANLNTANIDHVEILKGPQSILFGLMQPGGVVNYVTKRPLALGRAEISTIFDEHGRKELRTDLGGPVNADGSIRYRFNASLFDSDLFTDQEFAKGYFIAPELEFDLSKDATLSVSMSYLDEERLEQGYVGLLAGTSKLAWDPTTFIGATGLPGKDQQELTLTTTLTQYLDDDLRLRLVGGYHEYDLQQLESFSGVFGGVPSDGMVDIGVQKIDQHGKDHIFQADLLWELESASVSHQITLGLDYNHHEQKRNQASDESFYGQVDVFNPVLPDGAATPFAPAAFPQSSSDRTWAGIYLQDVASLLDDKLHVVGNIRWDRFDQTSTNFSGVTDSYDTDDYTLRLGALWEATDWVSPYVSWSESYMPTNATTTGGDLLDPEEGTQYEAGFKFGLLEDNLDVTLSAFRIDRDNVPIDDPTTTDPGSINGGLFRSEGFEIETVGRITDNLQVLAGFGALDAEVVRSDSLNPGDQIQGVPETTANLWLSYDWNDGPLEGLGIGAGAFYRGDIVTQFSQFVGTYETDSYLTADISSWYRTGLSNGVDLKLGLTMQNVFDEEYGVGGFGGGVQAGQPRTLIASVGIAMNL